jgi:hypothetical protein
MGVIEATSKLVFLFIGVITGNAKVFLAIFPLKLHYLSLNCQGQPVNTQVLVPTASNPPEKCAQRAINF